jgi:1,4-alpha-glucan branching enzyme
VRSFLISSALFWLDRYHFDGLRICSLGSILSRERHDPAHDHRPDVSQGQESHESIDFLRRLSEAVSRFYPDVRTFAEEPEESPIASRPLYLGGLGFGYKWDLQFPTRTLKYFSQDPVLRKYFHDELTSRAGRPANDPYVLPLSHDAVARGNGSLLARMPGDNWQKFANLRLLYGYLFLQPGKKLLFMGNEFGPWNEWKEDTSLDWHLVAHGGAHSGLQRWVEDLNRLYRENEALSRGDAHAGGFEWIDVHDSEQSTLSWLRRDESRGGVCLAVCNFTPVVRHNFRVGVPCGGYWNERLNSDAKFYGGGGHGNFGGAEASPFGWHGRSYSLNITLPPLAMVVFVPEEREGK